MSERGNMPRSDIQNEGIDALLVHSPLVGPATMRPLAAAFGARGWIATVPDLRGRLSSPAEFVAAAVAAVSHVDVVVAHSGAGAMLPLIADRADASAAVFVDAVVPGEGPSFTPSAGFIDLLATIAVDGGLLAPWHSWWPAGTMERLLPDDAQRAEIEADVPRVPRAFYDGSIELPARWWDRPCAYLQLSPAYDDDRTRAERWGWPVARIDGGHLDVVSRPDVIADRVSALVERDLRSSSEGGSS